MKTQSASSRVLLDCVPTILARVFVGSVHGRAETDAPNIAREARGVLEQDDIAIGRIFKTDTGCRPEILVPVDFSPGSQAAVDYAINVAQSARARLILLHAVYLNLTPYGPANPNWLRAALCREALDKMEIIMARAQRVGVPVISVIEEGAPPKVISEAARRWKIDLVVMSARERGWWGKLLGQRIQEKVMQDAKCPIVVFRTDLQEGATV